MEPARSTATIRRGRPPFVDATRTVIGVVVEEAIGLVELVVELAPHPAPISPTTSATTTASTAVHRRTTHQPYPASGAPSAESDNSGDLCEHWGERARWTDCSAATGHVPSSSWRHR